MLSVAQDTVKEGKDRGPGSETRNGDVVLTPPGPAGHCNKWSHASHARRDAFGIGPGPSEEEGRAGKIGDLGYAAPSRQ